MNWHRRYPQRHFALALAVTYSLAIGAAPAASPPSQTQQTLECAQKNLPPLLRADQITLTAYDRENQSRDYRIQIYAQRDNKLSQSTIRIDAPPDIVGRAYLIRSTGKGREVYVYIPSLKKVRRIADSGKGDSSLLGTDLSVSDLILIGDAFRYGSLSYAGKSQYQGRSTHDLLLLPSPSQQIGYDRLKLQLDQQTCVPLHVELLTSGKPHKEYAVAPDKLTQAPGGYWYAGESELRNLREGTRTTISISNVGTHDLPTGIFSPRNFYRP